MSHKTNFISFNSLAILLITWVVLLVGLDLRGQGCWRGDEWGAVETPWLGALSSHCQLPHHLPHWKHTGTEYNRTCPTFACKNIFLITNVMHFAFSFLKGGNINCTLSTPWPLHSGWIATTWHWILLTSFYLCFLASAWFCFQAKPQPYRDSPSIPAGDSWRRWLGFPLYCHIHARFFNVKLFILTCGIHVLFALPVLCN